MDNLRNFSDATDRNAQFLAMVTRSDLITGTPPSYKAASAIALRRTDTRSHLPTAFEMKRMFTFRSR